MAFQWVTIRQADFRLMQGTLKEVRSGRFLRDTCDALGGARSTCSLCGTPVALRRTDAADQEETHIATGSLDNVEELAPQEEWFPEQRPSWVPPLPAPLLIQALHD